MKSISSTVIPLKSLEPAGGFEPSTCGLRIGWFVLPYHPVYIIIQILSQRQLSGPSAYKYLKLLVRYFG